MKLASIFTLCSIALFAIACGPTYHADPYYGKEAYYEEEYFSEAAEDFNEISMNGWRERNQISDRLQQSEVNTIHGRETGIDPYTGQSVNVESGYNHYYQNQFGEYIGTNDEFYNPERDPNINHQEWKRMQVPNGGGY